MKTREDLKHLIPDSKFFEPDVSALLALSEAEISVIYPELFEWTEDANWPVARVLITLLGRFGDVSEKHFRMAAEKDAQWLAFLMNAFLDPMPQKNLESLKPLLVRLATAATPYERECGTDISAKEILNARLGGNFDLSV